MTTAIDKAIEAAKAQALAVADAPATPGTSVAIPNTPARGTPMQLGDFSVGSMNVETWLKVKEFGLLIGANDTLFDDVTVIIDPKEIQVCDCIKYGNPAIYLKSYDGVVCAQGGSWEAAQIKATSADPRARSYKSADIPMALVDDVKDKDGKVLVKAGTRVGHSLSTTNRNNFQTFVQVLTNHSLMTTPLKVKIGFEKRSNQAGNKWGVLTFELLGAAEEADDSE